MTTQTNTHTRPVDHDRIARVSALLGRYPTLTDDEMGEVLSFIRKGPALELGLLGGDEALKPQLDRFRADHARSLSIGGKEIAVIVAIFVIVIVATILLWDSGGGR